MQSAKAQKSPRKPISNDRITARIPRANRAIIERAAAVYGATVNQFVVQTALDRASEILEREETRCGCPKGTPGRFLRRWKALLNRHGSWSTP